MGEDWETIVWTKLDACDKHLGRQLSDYKEGLWHKKAS